MASVALCDLEVDGYGFERAFVSEVEPFCCELLRQKYPETPNLGDITREGWLADAQACGPIDLLIGGPPCTSYSSAGKRGGLNDPRGQLILHYYAIAQALRPTWFIFENVPGILSSGGGRDFGAFLRSMAGCGYTVSYRLLDANGFGLAQRRKRVFALGHLGDHSAPQAVLFEPQGEGRDSQKGRKTRKKPARTPGPGPEDGLSGGSATLGSEEDVATCVQPFNVNATYSCAKERHTLETETARCLDSSGGFAAQQGGTVVVEQVPASGANTFTNTGAGWWNESDETTALAHREYKSATTLVVNPEATEAQAFYTGGGTHNAMCGDPAPPLKVCQGGGHGGTTSAVIRQGVRYVVRRLTPVECELLQGLPRNYTLIRYPEGRSRLKPEVLKEVLAYLNDTTERVWTEAEVKELCADSHRYRAIGNGWAVHCVRWIGERLLRVQDMLERGEEIPTEMA
jgi:DNA (cytosine-5)-methyltransferase 1